MEALITLTGVVVVPIVVASLLARHTNWPRFVVASAAGAPLPLILFGVALVDYLGAVDTPPDRCGMSCGLDKALSPDIMAVAVGYIAIAVGIAFLTATVVRRRRR